MRSPWSIAAEVCAWIGGVAILVGGIVFLAFHISNTEKSYAYNHWGGMFDSDAKVYASDVILHRWGADAAIHGRLLGTPQRTTLAGGRKVWELQFKREDCNYQVYVWRDYQEDTDDLLRYNTVLAHCGTEKVQGA